MSSAKRFDVLRTILSVLIALAISFGIIFMVSDQPIEAIKHLLTGPLTSKRNMGNVVESMIPLIFTGTGVCIMFSEMCIRDSSCTEEDILLSQIIPPATRRIPASFGRLKFLNRKASKRMPAVSCPIRRRIVDSITFRRESVTIEIRNAIMPNAPPRYIHQGALEKA